MASPFRDPLLEALTSWTAESRLRTSQAERAAGRWQSQLAWEETSLGGLLVDLFERESPIRLTTTSGRWHAGSVSRLGSDFCAISSPDRPTLVIPLAAIAEVDLDESLGSVGSPSGRKLADADGAFGELLAFVSADKPLIRYALCGSDHVRSAALHAVGQDVAVMQSETKPVHSLFVSLSQLTEVTIAT